MKSLIYCLTASILYVGSASGQTLTTDKPVYTPGEAVTVSWTGGPGNGTDWIGVYKPNDAPGPTPSTQWTYIGGATEGSTTFSGLATADWKV